MQHVLILGGGYAGIAALKELSKIEDIKITLIDRHPYHFLQTKGYELVANTISFDKTIVNLHSLCESFGDIVSFLHDVVEDIDLDKKVVQCSFKKISFMIILKKVIEKLYKWPLWFRCRKY